MKVLQVCKYYPPVMGGMESVAWELTEGLNRAGVPTDVLCADQSPYGHLERTASGYTVRRAASAGTLLATSLSATMFWHLHRMAREVDVVHLHMPDPLTALAFRLVQPRGRLVLHWHSDVVRQRRAMALYEPVQRWMLERADVVIATSAPYAAGSPALAPWQSKLRVVPIGIGDHRPEACSAQAQALRRLVHGRRIVFALGRMTYYKGFDVLIEAATSLPEDCAVVIGGAGELLEPMRQKVRRLGLSGRVLLPGHIDDAELPSYYEACDMFCVSSTVRSEAYGVAMLEAMVMGKPVVATQIPASGVPWVNVDGLTGLNVPPGQPGPLAEALLRLLHDAPLRQRMGQAARQRFEQCFTAERMTREVLRIYQEMMG